MKDGPDISPIIDARIDAPRRASILTAHLAGRALAAAGITPAVASGHLPPQAEAGPIRPRKQNRHRHFAQARNAADRQRRPESGRHPHPTSADAHAPAGAFQT
ncbi:transcriptional regulator, ArsR family protein [Rhodovulum sulfidophilum]|uniref:Transcriptional regulator, ArsR family protein n=1 Tax=Rhodovulum sulfidophilum TaxID=35806 RepID=A0A0D6B2D4_RHOSU|nr:transcriptional regulator, ArsR family protein [Rhodovulum sulfidophilum]